MLDCSLIYRERIISTHIPIRLAGCRNRGIPSSHCSYLPIAVYRGNFFVTGRPVDGGVGCVVGSDSSGNSNAVANGQDTFRFVQNNLLNIRGDGNLGLSTQTIRHNTERRIGSVFRLRGSCVVRDFGICCGISNLCFGGSNFIYNRLCFCTLCSSGDISNHISGDYTLTICDCGYDTILIDGCNVLIAGLICQLDLGRILRCHLSSKGFTVLAVRDEFNGIGSLDSGRSNYDLNMGRRRNVCVRNGNRDISLTGTDCSDQTGLINRGNLFVGGSPSEIQLGCCLCNLFLLSLVVGAILDIELLGFTLFQHNVGGQPH